MASSASGALISIEDTRARANKFATDRSWAQFHTADNLLLALNGEIGEVCEIFQFRGSLDDFKFSKDQSVFSAGEVIHIGEEISDVIIYTTRLSDVTHIDLASAVSAKVTGKSLASPRPRPDEEVSSTPCRGHGGVAVLQGLHGRVVTRGVRGKERGGATTEPPGSAPLSPALIFNDPVRGSHFRTGHKPRHLRHVS